MSEEHLPDNEFTRLKRGRVVLRILFVLIILNLIDLFYTIREIVKTEGSFKDGNFIVQFFYEYFDSPDIIVLIKLAALALFCTICGFAREYYLTEIGVIVLTIVYTAVALHWMIVY
jgi:hypothetical protein